MRNVLSREEFTKMIEEMRDRSDMTSRYDQMIRDEPLFGDTRDFFSMSAFTMANTDTVMRLLGTMFCDTDDDIGYFCYERDYGRDWPAGCYTDAEGNDVDLSDAGKLYDHLVSHMDE